ARKPSRGKGKNWAANPADLMGSARIAYAADAILLYHTMEDDEVGGYAWPVPWDDQQNASSLQHDGIAPVKLTLAKGRDGMRRGGGAVGSHYAKYGFPGGGEGISAAPPAPLVPPAPQGGGPGGGAGAANDHIYYLYYS